MNISGRQQRVGAIWGALAFCTGIAIAWLFVEPNGGDPGRLKEAVWIFLSSHYLTIGPMKVQAVVNSMPRLGLLANGNLPKLWYAIPVFVTALFATGVNISMGRTRDPNLITQNSAVILVGYIPVALIAAVWSGATGAVGWLLAVIAGGFLALAVGSRAVGGVAKGVPVFAITSLGGLVVIGLIVLLTGFVIIQILIPVVVFAIGGIALGSGIVYAARSYF